MKEKIKVEFRRGIRTVKIPLMPNIGSYDQLHEAIQRIEYPKATRRIEAQLTLSIDLKDGLGSYTSFEVSVQR